MNVDNAVDATMVCANDANDYNCSTVLPQGVPEAEGKELGWGVLSGCYPGC